MICQKSPTLCNQKDTWLDGGTFDSGVAFLSATLVTWSAKDLLPEGLFCRPHRQEALVTAVKNRKVAQGNKRLMLPDSSWDYSA